MDRFTSDIGRVLREEHLPPVSVDAALVDVERRAARRRRTRNVAGALGATMAVAAIAVGVAVRAGSGEHSQDPIGPTPSETPSTTVTIPLPAGAVPWSDRTDFVEWQPPVVAPRASTTPCTADDLRVWKIETDGAVQSEYLTPRLSKTTAGRCTLDGYAVLTGLDGGGERVVIPVAHSDQPFSGTAETPATIEQHESSWTTVISGRNCEAGQGEAPLPNAYGYRDLELRLPDGSSLPLRRDLGSVCQPKTTPYYRDNAPIEQPVRWESLIAEVTLPPSVRAGETLTYIVTLRNIGTKNVDLTPCAGFSQELAFEDMNGNPLAKPVYERRRLNCDDAPVLQPGSERSYVMNLPVPQTAIHDEARLTWQLVDTSPDYSGQGFVSVTH